MAFDHGSKAKFFLTSGGSSRDMSAFLSEAGLERSADPPDVTALGDDAHKYIPGLPEGSSSLDGHYDPVGYGYVDAVINTITPFEYRPQGTGTGKPTFTGNCVVSSLNLNTPVDDKASMSFEVAINGKPTLGTQA